MKRIFLAIAVSLLIVSAPALGQEGQLPDKMKTPGVALKQVPDEKVAACLTDLIGDKIEVDETITVEMICTKGYTKCIRNVSTAIKRAVYKSYGMPQGNHTGTCDVDQGCEVDHLISLELGGANDRKNLWPQPYDGLKFNAHVKDQLENFLHDQVCSGKITLTTAQKEISTDWVATYKKRIGEPE
jgi:hypothetical protein